MVSVFKKDPETFGGSCPIVEGLSFELSADHPEALGQFEGGRVLIDLATGAKYP
jgi:hypothetical protein